MATSTLYLRQKLAETILNGEPLTNWLPSSRMYVGLWKVIPTLPDASDGQEHTIGQGNYARVEVKNKWTLDPTVEPQVSYRLNTLLSFESTSSGWNGNGTSAPVAGIGFFSEQTGGNCLIYGDLNPVRVIHPNQDMDIDVDGLIVNFPIN